MSAEIGARQAAILRAIVREYIRTGEPVGSKVLADRSRIHVSSATVRSEMARLEELGYLIQPHTSAGRIPSEHGYRFVVDQIKAPRPLAEGQQRALAEELGEGEPASIDELLHRASDVVSRFTHHAAAVLARRARPSTLRRLEMFPMGTRMAMLVLIAENGRVEQRLIPLEPTVTDADVDGLCERLSRDLHGVALESAARSIAEHARSAPARERGLLEAVHAAFQALLAADEQVVVGGVANLASEQDFERETLLRLYRALEHQAALLEVLASALDDPAGVRIGSELPGEDFRECSVVVATIGGTAGARGSVGVIGPTRMDYERVIATASAVARMLEGTLGATD